MGAPDVGVMHRSVFLFPRSILRNRASIREVDQADGPHHPGHEANADHNYDPSCTEMTAEQMPNIRPPPISTGTSIIDTWVLVLALRLRNLLAATLQRADR